MCYRRFSTYFRPKFLPRLRPAWLRFPFQGFLSYAARLRGTSLYDSNVRSANFGIMTGSKFTNIFFSVNS